MITKKGWFSDPEMVEIFQRINWESRQQDTNTITDAPNSEKQEHCKRNDNRKVKDKKRIMYENTWSPFLGSQDWKPVKADTGKVNKY